MRKAYYRMRARVSIGFARMRQEVTLFAKAAKAVLVELLFEDK